jgi:hypothetical protein
MNAPTIGCCALSLALAVSCATPLSTARKPDVRGGGRERERASPPTSAQPPAATAGAGVTGARKYVNVGTPRAVLEHVEVIDGTGAPPKPDQNVVLVDGKIAAVGPTLPPTGPGTSPRNTST